MKILIVDDHSIVREGIRVLLELEKDVEYVHEASSGMKSIEMIEKSKYDIILMDIRMPGIDGIETTRILKQKCPDTKIVLLTNYDDEEFVMEAIQVGADGYILKDVKKGDLVNIIRNVIEGKSYIDSGVTYSVIRRVRESITKTGEYHKRPDLSQRELQILEYLVMGKSNKEIADVVCLSLDTVKAHLKNIYKKLNVASRSQAVQTAVKGKIIHL
jgi:DNA-binding NarL/FixJ family response regulator